MEDLEQQIRKTLNEVEDLFKKDDIHSASRESLEVALLTAHDGLNALLEIVRERV